MTDVTRILSAIGQGDPHAAEQLLPLVYDELRRLAAEKMAQENPGQTLQAKYPCVFRCSQNTTVK
jgi:DNA-binding GntR family transcriptional regulator